MHFYWKFGCVFIQHMYLLCCCTKYLQGHFDKKWSDFFPDCCQCVDTMVPTDCSDDGSETWSWPPVWRSWDCEGRSTEHWEHKTVFLWSQRAPWLHSAELPADIDTELLRPVRSRTWAEHHEDTSHCHSENIAEDSGGLMSVPSCFRFSISSSSLPWPRRGRSLRPPPHCCWGPWPGWGSPASASFSLSLNRGHWPLWPRFQDSSLRSPGQRQITGRSGSTTIIAGNCVKIK